MFHKIAGLLLTSPQHASQISRFAPHIPCFLARFPSSKADFREYAGRAAKFAQYAVIAFLTDPDGFVLCGHGPDRLSGAARKSPAVAAPSLQSLEFLPIRGTVPTDASDRSHG